MATKTQTVEVIKLENGNVTVKIEDLYDGVPSYTWVLQDLTVETVDILRYQLFNAVKY